MARKVRFPRNAHSFHIAREGQPGLILGGGATRLLCLDGGELDVHSGNFPLPERSLER